MRKALSIVASCLIAAGAFYATSIVIDALALVKERFHGPHIDRGDPSVPPSATDVSYLQQVRGGVAA